MVMGRRCNERCATYGTLGLFCSGNLVCFGEEILLCLFAFWFLVIGYLACVPNFLWFVSKFKCF